MPLNKIHGYIRCYQPTLWIYKIFFMRKQRNRCRELKERCWKFFKDPRKYWGRANQDRTRVAQELHRTVCLEAEVKGRSSGKTCNENQRHKQIDIIVSSHWESLESWKQPTISSTPSKSFFLWVKQTNRRHTELGSHSGGEWEEGALAGRKECLRQSLLPTALPRSQDWGRGQSRKVTLGKTQASIVYVY